jgi:hypothetical protein
MTEEQAREKWCPMPGIPNAKYVKDTCVASKCMMWRWKDRTWDDKVYEGHCGLAGKE